MILEGKTIEMISLFSVALATHDIDLKNQFLLFAHEKASNYAQTIPLSNYYEQKLQKYITTFDKILTDAIIQKAIQNTLDKIDEKYANYEAWTSEDMLLLLLQEFVRLFHAEEVGKEQEIHLSLSVV